MADITPPADDVRELIAEARRFQSFKTFQYPETDLIRRLADALEVRPRGTVTDAEVRAAALAMYRITNQLSMSGATDLARAALEAAQEARNA